MPLAVRCLSCGKDYRLREAYAGFGLQRNHSAEHPTTGERRVQPWKS